MPIGKNMIITFYKFNGKANRYYTIHDRQGDLFSTFTFTAVWGVELYGGREKRYVFEDRAHMEKKIRRIFKERIKKGYKVLYSFARRSDAKELIDNAFKENIG